MLIKRFKKTLAVFLSAVTVLIVSTGSAYAASSGKSDSDIADGWEIVYQDNFVGWATKSAEQPIDYVYPDIDEMTLVSVDEYAKGEYRFVNKVYTLESAARSNQTFWHGWTDIYYDIKSTNSLFLGSMHTEAYFYIDAEQNYAVVDKDSIHTYTKKEITGQTYPIFTDISVDYRSDVGGLFGSKRYAFTEYTIKIEKSWSVCDILTSTMKVNSANECSVEGKYA